MELKDEIRKRVLKLRTGLSAEEIRSKSTAIFERIYALRQYKEAATVLAYMDYKNEVMTGEFIKKCLHDGKRVALPKVVVEDDISALSVPDRAHGKLERALSVAEKVPALSVPDKVPTLSIYEINDIDKDTLPCYKGIIEPDSTVLKLLDPSEIDLAVIPGVAFDQGKNRIGYGAGYYDRFLHKLRADCLKVSVAFDLQLVDIIPAGRYDVPVDMVITEELLIE
jgi:5-formyltetrahydrofolate cyclo-ligase